MNNRSIHAWLLLALVALVGFRMCLREVPLDRVGVKSNQVGGGVVKKDYGPGYAFVIPGVQRFFLLDPTIQDYTMAPEVTVRTERSEFSYTGLVTRAGRTFTRGEPIQLRTQDEFTADIDITVLYRIRPGEAHRVLVEIGPEDRFHHILEQQARKIIWEILARLSCPDLYDAKKRVAQSEMARHELNQALAPYHLEVMAVLIRNITFQKEFEQKLLDLQMIDQRQLLAKAQQQAEQAKEKTQLIQKSTSATVLSVEAELGREQKALVAKTGLQVAQIEADAKFTAQKKIAEADSFKRQQIALGDLAKTSATAVGDRAMAEAYQGAGGELYLARQTLESLEIGDIELNTSEVNPFDVQQVLEMIGLNPEALKPKP